MNTLDIGGFLLGLLSALPVLLAFAAWLSLRQGTRRRLQLQARETVDVVVTTSTVLLGTQGPAVKRPTTSIGQLLGVTSIARAIGRYYPKKAIQVHMSVRVTHRLNRDLILLGGPIRNEISSSFLDHLKKAGIEFAFDDVAGQVSLGNQFDIDEFDVRIRDDGTPTQDLAIIIVWHNPFAGTIWRRSVLCAGITSYGTAAAIQYLFDDLTTPASRRNVGASGELRRLRKSNACFIFVGKVTYSEGPTVIEVAPLAWGTFRTGSPARIIVASGS